MANQYAEQLSQIDNLRNNGASKESMVDCALELCNQEASPYYISESLLLSEGRFIKSEVSVVSCLDPDAEQIIIPDGVAVLDKECFANCASLKEIVLPSSLIEIKKGAFKNCSALASCDLPENLAFLAYSAFEGCSSLEVVIPWRANVDFEFKPLRNAKIEVLQPVPSGVLSLSFDEASHYFTEDGQICQKPTVPESAYCKLAESPYIEERQLAVSRIKQDPQALALLARDENKEIRHKVAVKRMCPPEVVALLLKDPDPQVREAACTNPQCDAQALIDEAQNPNSTLHPIIAALPNCPAEAFEALAEDDSWRIKFELAGNPNCPVHILERLAEDEDKDEIAPRATKNLRKAKRRK